LIDLDPYHCGYDRIVEAAQLVREKLRVIGLTDIPRPPARVTGCMSMCRWKPIYTSAQDALVREILRAMGSSRAA